MATESRENNPKTNQIFALEGIYAIGNALDFRLSRDSLHTGEIIKAVNVRLPEVPVGEEKWTKKIVESRVITRYGD